MDKWTPERVAHELLAVVPLLTRIVAAEVRREAGDDTTMQQFRVLTHLAEGVLTVSGLARRRRVTLQAMGELVQILVERGWIARSPDPSHYERVQARVLDQIVPLLARLDTRETAAVQAALPALRRVFAGDEEVAR